eukprot:540866-Alexandrium_andersonii.AAC.1
MKSHADLMPRRAQLVLTRAESHLRPAPCMPAPLARCAVQRHTSVAPSNWVVSDAERSTSRIMCSHGHAVVAGPHL